MLAVCAAHEHTHRADMFGGDEDAIPLFFIYCHTDEIESHK